MLHRVDEYAQHIPNTPKLRVCQEAGLQRRGKRYCAESERTNSKLITNDSYIEVNRSNYERNVFAFFSSSGR